MQEVKKALKEMAEKIDGMAENVSKISSLFEDFKKRNNLLELEKRTAELEQYTLKKDVVISGLTITHCTQSNVIRGERSSNDLTDDSPLVRRVSQLTILIPGEKHKMERKIILRYVHRKQKTKLLKQGKKLKNKEVYFTHCFSQSFSIFLKDSFWTYFLITLPAKFGYQSHSNQKRWAQTD